MIYKTFVIILVVPFLVGCSHVAHDEDSWPWESLFSKAEAARLKKDYPVAANLYTQALPIAAETSQPEMNLAITLGRLGLVDSGARTPSLKQKNLDKSIKIFEKLYANGSKDDDLLKKEYIRSLTTRGELARTMKEYASAEMDYERALGLIRTISQNSGKGDLLLSNDRLLCHAGLGEIEGAAGKVDESAKNYKLALAEEVIAEDMEHRLRTEYDQQLAKMGKSTPGTAMQGTATSAAGTQGIVTQSTPVQSLVVLPSAPNRSLNNLAQDRWKENIEAGLAAQRRQEYAVSEKRFRQALSLVKAGAPCDNLVLRTYEYLIECMQSSKEFSKAEEYFVAVSPCLSNRVGDDLKIVERIYGSTASVYKSQRKYEEEEQILRQQLKVRGQIRDISGTYGAEVECDIGSALLAQQNYRKAESCLVSALNKLQRAGGNATQTRKAVLMLMQCYVGEKKNIRALELRRQHPEIFSSEVE